MHLQPDGFCQQTRRPRHLLADPEVRRLKSYYVLTVRKTRGKSFCASFFTALSAIGQAGPGRFGEQTR